MTSKPKPPTEPRAVHRPLSIRIESVSALPDIRELPQDTQMTINLKMDKAMSYALMAEMLEQLKAAPEVDFIAVTVTGVS